MHRVQRSTILYLVAVGRMTPAEAERLMMTWSDLRESEWIVAGCMVLAVLGLLHGQGWFAHAWGMHAQHAISLFKFWLGGTI
jgi:hypothetical protein